MNDDKNEKCAQLRAAIEAVTDPRSGTAWGQTEPARLGSETLYVSVRENGSAHAVLELPQPPGDAEQQLGRAMEQAMQQVEGISSGRLVITCLQAGAKPKPTTSPPEKISLPGINKIIAVASAKGGVGKSTLTVNLALAALAEGWRVGIMDADIHGPSIPTMLGTADQRPQTRRENGKPRLLPIAAHGLTSLSVGNMAEPDTAMAWRGPMASSVMAQILGDSLWGELDVLFIDTPPGTGDLLLTLAQKVPIDGAIIVSTPQIVALADIRRGTNMLGKIGVPLLGLVENMSWFEDADGQRIAIFGNPGQGEQTAKMLDMPFLGGIPLHPSISAGGDSGRPSMLEPGAISEYYASIARTILAAIGLKT